MRRRLVEFGILLLLWVPIAVIVVFVQYRVERIAGHEWTAYAISAVAVIAGWIGTEVVLQPDDGETDARDG